MLTGKTFLITGSTGRLGCDTVSRLEELNANVLPLVLKGYPIKPKRIKWMARTNPIIIESTSDLEKLPLPDYVINLHWQVNRTLPFTEQLLNELDNNIHSFAFFWDWILDRQINKFVNISSIKIFSHLNKNPISAKDEPMPISPYGIAKLAAEKFFKAYFLNSNISIIDLCLGSVASIGENPSQLMSQLKASIFNKKKITINTNHIANLIYIDDAIDLIINTAVNASKGRYILAADGVKNDKIASEFELVSQQKLNAEYIDFMPGIPDPIFISDIPKLNGNLLRQTTLKEMIEKFIHAET